MAIWTSKSPPGRKALIAALSRAAKAAPPPGAPAADERTVLAAELIDAGCLTGKVFRNRNGQLIDAAVQGITLQGRSMLEDLQQKELEQSPTSRLLRWIPVAAAYLAGLLSPILTEWLRRALF